MNDNEGARSFSPDGLTEQVIDALLREVDAAVAGVSAGWSAGRWLCRCMRCHWFLLARMDGSRDGRERWSVVGGWLSAGTSPHYLMPPHLLAAGDGRNRTEINEARPDGPNRQERAHQAGAPESLAPAIEEI